MVGHGGRTIEQTSFLALLPEHGFALAVLTNFGDGANNILYDLGAALMQELYGLELKAQPTSAPSDLKPQDIDLSKLETCRIVGRYRCAAGELDLSVQGARLRGVYRANDPAIPGKVKADALTLVPMGGDKFAIIMDDPELPRPICELVTEGGADSPFSHLFAIGRVFSRTTQ